MMRRRPAVLIAEPDGFSREATVLLQANVDLEMRRCTSEELARACALYDAIWIRLGHRIDRVILGKTPRCRFFAVPATGLDHIDLEACGELGIEVLSLKGESDFLREVRATAELTLGLVLALMRKIPHAYTSVREGTWDRDRFRGRELYRQTAGIVGLGRLGSIVAGYFHAFGMTVLGYDPSSDCTAEYLERVDSLGELLRRSDVVSLHVAYDRSTHHMIASRELGLMKSTAILVNTSRGGVVDGNALLDALRSGVIAGAALDVVEGEPHITADHPVVRATSSMDNLLVVPHIGGNTHESLAKTELFIARRLLEALRQGTG